MWFKMNEPNFFFFLIIFLTRKNFPMGCAYCNYVSLNANYDFLLASIKSIYNRSFSIKNSTLNTVHHVISKNQKKKLINK